MLTSEPAAMAATAAQLQTLGTTMTTTNAVAAAPTIGVLPPAADATSALLALAFATHGGVYQAAWGVATAINELFVGTMGVSGLSYEATEAANILGAL